MSDSLDNVVDFKPRPKSEASIAIKKRERFCPHLSIVIDEERQLVQCQNCSEEMSPMQGLMIVGRNFERFNATLVQLKMSIQYLQQRREAMIADERNIKARIRRAARKIKP